MAMSSDDLNRTGHQPSQARPHRCSKCDKSFTTVQGRNLHEKLHDGIYQYNCPHCGKGCSGTTQLRGHMATHTQVKEFKCPICGHAYVYKKTLTDHIKRLHMDILSMPIMWFGFYWCIDLLRSVLASHIIRVNINYWSRFWVGVFTS